MRSGIDVITEFPMDGRRWWISWVGGYHLPHATSANRAVGVRLSAIPPIFDEVPLSRLDTAQLGAMPTEVEPKRLSVGAVPRLVMGAVFKNGIQQGFLPTSSIKMKFDRSQDVYCGIHTASEDVVALRKEWMSRRSPPISFETYRLDKFHQSMVVVLKQGEKILVIPCQEIFRTLYAPHREIALALMRGPWAHHWQDVVNPAFTWIRADGAWQIKLRLRVKNPYAPYLARLLFDPKGLVEANRIYPQLAGNPQNTWLRVDFPFEWDRLSIWADGIKLKSPFEKYLVFRLKALTWPDQNQLIVRDRDNSNEITPDATPNDGRIPFLKTSKPTDGVENEYHEVASAVDPNFAANGEEFDAPALRWVPAPKIEELPKETSNTYTRAPTDDGVGASILSPGEGHWGNPDIGQAIYGERTLQERAARFDELQGMLDRLAEARVIKAWTIFRSSAGGRFRGDLEVWDIPLSVPGAARSNWASIDHQARTALVCRIDMAGVSLYWLEIETKKSEGYRSVIFSVSPTAVVQTVRALLREARAQKGVWGDARLLREAVDADALETWKHHWVAWRATADENSEAKPVWDASSALKVIRRVAAATPREG